MSIKWNDEGEREMGERINPATRNEFADPPPGYRQERPDPASRLREVDLANFPAQPTMRDRQQAIARLVRYALTAIETAVEVAGQGTPENVQLRELAAGLDNFATDCERRAQS